MRQPQARSLRMDPVGGSRRSLGQWGDRASASQHHERMVMKSDCKVTDLLSDIAMSGPPLFFPDPSVPVTFNFDQGIAAEDTFPLEELKQLAVEVLDEDKARALEYISFGYDSVSDTIEYLPSYIELVLGHAGLREQ